MEEDDVEEDQFEDGSDKLTIGGQDVEEDGVDEGLTINRGPDVEEDGADAGLMTCASGEREQGWLL